MAGPDHQGLSVAEILSLRNDHVAGACKLHFMKSPLKIVRSKGQYMFDEHNKKYLDCTSRTSAVGHCHPEILAAASMQISTLNVAPGDQSEDYSKRLLATLPSNFQTCLFTNSGGEANDLALQLAKRYTGRSGVAVVEGSFHGAVVSLMDISLKAFRVTAGGHKPWVHVLPCPVNDGKNNADEAVRILDEAKRNNQEIGCFICEPVLIVPGVIVPPKDWLKSIYRYIQSNGGVVISDEIVTGMGRTGSHFWAFDAVGDGAVPDIVTIGKPLGNGYPVAAVLTSDRLANLLSPTERLRFQCGPVESVIGLTVLRILLEEQLLSNVVQVGNYFKERLKELRDRHRNIGQVRGIGLIIGVEIVNRNGSPSPDLADLICYRLKDRRVLVAAEGYENNILTILPPYCISIDDVNYILQMFDETLLEIAIDQDVYTFLEQLENGNVPSVWTLPETNSSAINNTIDYKELD